MLLSLLLFACSSSEPATSDSPTSSSTTTTEPTAPTEPVIDTANASPSADTGGATEPTTEAVDCAALPTPPLSTRPVDGLLAFHGIAMMDDGYAVGWDIQAIVRSTNGSPPSVIRPMTGAVEQIIRDADGTLYTLLDGTLVRISYPDGVMDNITAIPFLPYGLAMGPDGLIYVANHEAIFRVDPDSGDMELWLENGYRPKVIAFSPENDWLYFGTNEVGGKVYKVPLNASLDPATPQLVGSTPGNYHDGLNVDICGNLYIAEFLSHGLYRMSLDGEVITLLQDRDDEYGHGVVFGRGLGGFLQDAIYQPQPYHQETVLEVVIGVPGREYTGPVINRTY